MPAGRSCQGLQGPTALQELHHDDDHRYDKEELEEAVERRGRDHPEKPSYHEDHHKGPQQGLLLCHLGRPARASARRGSGECSLGAWAALRRVCSLVVESIAISEHKCKKS